MAIGADRGVLIETDVGLEPLAVAKLVSHVATKEGVQLVIFGKQAIDDDAGQAGQMFAALMGWPQATFASRVQIAGERAVVGERAGYRVDSARYGRHRRVVHYDGCCLWAAG